MTFRISRRKFIQSTMMGAAGLGALGIGAGLRPAAAAQTLTVVTWGGPWFESSQAVADQFASDRDLRFAWELHQGGAQKIVAKIKAAWPTVQYDVVAAWDPVFHAMMREDWLAPVDDLPNLKDIPEPYMTRNPEGQAVVVPMGITVTCWGYRTDMVEQPVRSFEDLLEPRFRGLVCMRTPTSYSGLPYVGIALEFGGDENNIDPAFEFLKELARRGNIGRVAGSDTDAINSMTTGETAFGFGVADVWERIQAAHPITPLMRVPTSKGLKGLIYKDGWTILKGPNVELAKEFANFSINPENASAIAGALTAFPANSKATPGDMAKRWSYESDELSTYAYVPDFGRLSEQVSDWSRRFELEITPLLRG